jgi:hypothetical protein
MQILRRTLTSAAALAASSFCWPGEQFPGVQAAAYSGDIDHGSRIHNLWQRSQRGTVAAQLMDTLYGAAGSVQLYCESAGAHLENGRLMLCDGGSDVIDKCRLDV